MCTRDFAAGKFFAEGEVAEEGLNVDHEYLRADDFERFMADRQTIDLLLHRFEIVGIESETTRLKVSTIALTDPLQIGQTDPVLGRGARGAVGRVSVGVADRPSGSTRLSG